MERKIPLKFKNSDGTFTVLPDDTRQLCGYDYDGNEIYEGDRLFYACEIRREEVDVPWKCTWPWVVDGNGKRIKDLKVLDFRNYYGCKAMLLPCKVNERLGTFDKHLEWQLVDKNGEYGGKLLGDPRDVNEYLALKAAQNKKKKSWKR